MDQMDDPKLPLSCGIRATASSEASNDCIYLFCCVPEVSVGASEWDWTSYSIDNFLRVASRPIVYPRTLASQSSPSYWALTPSSLGQMMVIIKTT